MSGKAKRIVVRKFRESDVDDVVELFDQDGLIHNDEEREKIRKNMEKNATNPLWYDHYLVAEVDGKVVGRVILEAAYPPYSELINIYVLPSYQGIGVGTRLSIDRSIDSKINLEVVAKEKVAKGTEDRTFTLSFWNKSTEPQRFKLEMCIPKRTTLIPSGHDLHLKIGPGESKHVGFNFRRSSESRLPEYTSFTTALVTCFFRVVGFRHPFFVSAGFDFCLS